MKKTLLTSVLTVCLACASASFVKAPPNVLYAQTSPASAHAQFTPSVDGPDQYAIFLDGAQVATFAATGCSQTSCSAPFTVPTYGSHSVTVASQSVTISTDPTSLSTGPQTAPSAFVLKKGNPASPTNQVVKQ